MTNDNYDDQEQRFLAYGAVRSCILEIRQRARAIGDHDGTEMSGLALLHLAGLRVPRPERSDINDDVVVPLFPRQISPTNALIALNRGQADE